MTNVALNCAATFLPNYSEIPNSCSTAQFTLSVDVPKVLIDRWHPYAEQIRYLRLCQPNCLAIDRNIKLQFPAGSHVDSAVAPQGEIGLAGLIAHASHV